MIKFNRFYENEFKDVTLDEMKTAYPKLIDELKTHVTKIRYGVLPDKKQPERLVVCTDPKEYDQVASFMDQPVPLWPVEGAGEAKWIVHMVKNIMENFEMSTEVSVNNDVEESKIIEDSITDVNLDNESESMKKQQPEETHIEKSSECETNTEDQDSAAADSLENQSHVDDNTQTTEEEQEQNAVNDVFSQENKTDSVVQYPSVKQEEQPVTKLPTLVEKVGDYRKWTDKEIEEKLKLPEFKVDRNSRGHLKLAHSGNIEVWVYGEISNADFTCSVYVYAVRDGKEGKARPISMVNIEHGAPALGSFMIDLGGVFSEADIFNAQQKLWMLKKIGKIKMRDLECEWNMTDIHEYFIDVIEKELSGINTVSVYAEKVNERIDIGIWQNVFDAHWRFIEEKTCISQRAWCKQAKANGWLLPDPGRGGGQHTPGEARSKLYNRKENDRIQRFTFEEKKAEELLAKRGLQIMINGEDMEK